MASEDNTKRPDRDDHAAEPREESALGLDVRQLLGLGRAAPKADTEETEIPPTKITPAVEPALGPSGDAGEESTPAAAPVADIEAEPAPIEERRSQPERRSSPEAPANPPAQSGFEDISDLVPPRERPPRPAFDKIETPLTGEEKKPAPAIAAPAPMPPEASLSEPAKGAAQPIPPVTAPSELSGLRPSIDPLAAGASLAAARPVSAEPAAPVPETPDLSAAANAKLEELASMSEKTLEEYESFDDFEETAPERSKRTPVIILASLLCVAVLAGGVVFAYRQGVKESTQTEVPVIVAEAKATKEEPSNPGGVQIPHQNKLIYDRILGEETDIAEKIVPREEKVVNLSQTPALTTVTKSTPQVNTVVEKAPAAPATPVIPGAGNDPAPASAVETVSDELAKKLAQVTPPKPLAPPDSLINGNSIISGLIVPGTTFVPGTTPAEVSRPLTETLNLPSSIQGLETIVPGDDIVRLETETVTGPPQVPAAIQPAENPETAVAAEDTAAPSTTPALSAKLPPILPRRKPARPAAATRVASAAQPATNTAAATTGGFVIQIAAFRSQDEALSRYAALKRRHSSLLRPYTSFIQRADLGDRGIYYRLRLGPIGGKDKASNLCRSLLSAGEKDCLVRTR